MFKSANIIFCFKETFSEKETFLEGLFYSTRLSFDKDSALEQSSR